ncbi:DUF2945 domain-containing protein [Thioclava sp. GXIMD2076]|uniref:DUF2945 domain-containing protein n=1 Tax=Thioclava kandeliae TaxID=3070818 RepID=A0ABV1SF18_9RHOB
MGNSYRTGQWVTWNWGQGEARGKIAARHEERVERQIDGSKITRNGSAENPAYEIHQEDGARVLKLGSELEAG